MGLTQLTPDILTQAISSLTPEQLKALGLRRQATDGEVAAYDQAHRSPGAPADFAGPVFSNPDAVKVSDDTESGIEPTRLPTGVTLQKQNFTGRTPGDTSNPAAAQILPGAMQTIGAKFDASQPEDKPKFDPAQEYTKEGAGGGTFDPNASYEVAPPPAAGPHVTMHPHNLVTGKPNPDFDDEPATSGEFLGNLAKSAAKDIYDISAPNLLNQVIKQKTGKDLAAKVGLHGAEMDKIPNKAAMIVIPALAGEFGAPEPVPGVRSARAAAEPAATESAIPPAARTALTKALTKFALKKIPGAHSVADAIQFAKDMGWTEEMAATKAAPAAEAVPMTDGTPWGKPILEKPAPPVETEAAAEDLEGVTSPQTEHAAATEAEEIPADTLAQVLSKPGSPADLQKALNDALGGKPLQKGVSLRNQGKTAAATPKVELPADYTPVDSSVLAGVKYDPTSETFHSVTNTGQHYAYQGVTPEDFSQFEANESKGTAWNTLRQKPGVVQVEKNFAPSRPAGMRNQSGEVIPKSKAGMQSAVMQKAENLSDFIRQSPAEALKTPAKKVTPKAAVKDTTAKPAASGDLTEQLQQSLDQVKAEKGGVFTSAAPGELLDRWGVDPESFAEGRSQTRGMKPQESEADLKKLTAAYKKGQAIEPVMETRDAQNNIIEVDGRGRALAAHRAGIERIPVIVRRLQ